MNVSDLLVANEALETAEESAGKNGSDPTLGLLLAACAAGAKIGMTLDQIQKLAAQAYERVSRFEDDTSPD